MIMTECRALVFMKGRVRKCVKRVKERESIKDRECKMRNRDWVREIRKELVCERERQKRMC